jgi:5-methylcytosine-specific restriction endonuclease McrA
MPAENYPDNWRELRRIVKNRDQNRCANCHRTDVPLEVHHVVPIGQGGSHQITNLVTLCPRCHLAAHGEEMAPRIRWYTKGELNSEEFTQHHQLWTSLRDRLGVPRYDPGEGCVYVPLSDAEKITQQLVA